VKYGSHGIQQRKVWMALYPTARNMVCAVSHSAKYGLHGIQQREVWMALFPTAQNMVCAVKQGARYGLHGNPKSEVWFARYSTAGDVVGVVSPSSQQDLCDFATVNHNHEGVILFYLVTHIVMVTITCH
jgi:hypothetical protein